MPGCYRPRVAPGRAGRARCARPVRFPAVLLALPVARLLAPLRTSVLVPLICVLAVATTLFGLYLLAIVGWAP